MECASISNQKIAGQLGDADGQTLQCYLFAIPISNSWLGTNANRLASLNRVFKKESKRVVLNWSYGGSLDKKQSGLCWCRGDTCGLSFVAPKPLRKLDASPIVLLYVLTLQHAHQSDLQQESLF